MPKMKCVARYIYRENKRSVRNKVRERELENGRFLIC